MTLYLSVGLLFLAWLFADPAAFEDMLGVDLLEQAAHRAALEPYEERALLGAVVMIFGWPLIILAMILLRHR